MTDVHDTTPDIPPEIDDGVYTPRDRLIEFAHHVHDALMKDAEDADAFDASDTWDETEREWEPEP